MFEWIFFASVSDFKYLSKMLLRRYQLLRSTRTVSWQHAQPVVTLCSKVTAYDLKQTGCIYFVVLFVFLPSLNFKIVSNRVAICCGCHVQKFGIYQPRQDCSQNGKRLIRISLLSHFLEFHRKCQTKRKTGHLVHLSIHNVSIMSSMLCIYNICLKLHSYTFS